MAQALRLRLFVTPATLRQFAEVNDAAAATTKKLQKQAILANYFRTLDDDDLRRAVAISIRTSRRTSICSLPSTSVKA